MFARTTQFEIDTLRISLDVALQQFKERVLPAIRSQKGYEGAYAFLTSEGRGMIVTLWATEEAAQAGVESGYYDEQISKFISFFRSPVGREHYEVVFAETPSESRL
jgi:heme-degrading monooxygenase HmoA